jgi:predicted CoA-binding protein
LRWYIDHKLPVYPINPTASAIESIDAVKRISALPSPAATSLSFLTQPAITLKSLQDAQESGVQRVWLQPGSFDDQVLHEAESMGFETVIANGRCILREGEKGLSALKRESRA